MMFLRSSSDWRTSSLIERVFMWSSLMVEAWLFFVNHDLKLLDTDFHLLDCPLACGNRVGLNFLNLDTEASDPILQSLLSRINFNHLGLFFPEKTLKVTSISTSLIGTVISKLKFLGNILVISGDSSKFLLNFDLELSTTLLQSCNICNLFVE